MKYDLMVDIFDNHSEQLAILRDMVDTLKQRIELSEQSIDDLYEIKKNKARYKLDI